jgi:NAD(P)-dependent dehydrogenase (short-subunit alcohol dehydrogenase family)
MFAPDLLQGQVAIITGGGTGIGLGIAERFGQLGAKVVIASRKVAHLEPALAQLHAQGIDAIAVPTDIRQPAAIDELVAATLARYRRIDILVNNAAGNFTCLAENLSVNGWNTVIDIVLNGTFYCSRAVGLEMIKQQRGRILNIVATYAWTGAPGAIHSASAKAGVITLTQTLAVEWARHNIRVNALAPGPVETPGAGKQLWAMPEIRAAIENRVPLKRFGSVEEMANIAAFLVSDIADYINGEVIVADGGAWLGKGFLALAEDFK